MRIISKFYDYYDSVVGMGYDPTIIYERVIKEFKKSKFSDISYIDEKIISIKNGLTGGGGTDNYYNRGRDSINVSGFESGFIFFCGEYYPFVFCDKIPHVFYWDSDKLLKDNKSEIKDYQKKYIIEYFKQSGKDVPYDIFFEMKAPIIYYGPDIENGSIFNIVIKTNVSLNKIQFYKRLDSWQTFQELCMFNGGVLGSGRPQLIEIKDKDMLFKKGFDNFSFKTQSPGKKAKRRNLI